MLVATQVLGGTGLFTGFAVSALLAQDLSGSTSLAGLPTAAAVSASALAALPISRWMARRGRRPGLALGYGLAAFGAAVVVAAAALGSFLLMLAGMGLFGVGNTSNLLARFAAADLSEPARRARAIATVLVATTVGAVLGPNLVEPTERLVAPLGFPPLTGPFALGVLAYAAGAVVVLALLRPDPLLTARAAAAEHAGTVAPPAPNSLRAAARSLSAPRARAGVCAMVVGNVAMIAIMTMTPVHLIEHGHSLRVVGVVISAHVAGMFLPSPVSGWLCDRVGRLPVLAAGGVTLMAAGVVAATADPASGVAVGLALVLLGVGWNLGLVGGSALLTDAVAAPERPQAQGAADLLMGAAGAVASLASGPALAVGGFLGLGLAGAALAAVLLVVVARARLAPPVPSRA